MSGAGLRQGGRRGWSLSLEHSVLRDSPRQNVVREYQVISTEDSAENAPRGGAVWTLCEQVHWHRVRFHYIITCSCNQTDEEYGTGPQVHMLMSMPDSFPLRQGADLGGGGGGYFGPNFHYFS